MEVERTGQIFEFQNIYYTKITIILWLVSDNRSMCIQRLIKMRVDRLFFIIRLVQRHSPPLFFFVSSLISLIFIVWKLLRGERGKKVSDQHRKKNIKEPRRISIPWISSRWWKKNKANLSLLWRWETMKFVIITWMRMRMNIKTTMKEFLN